MIKAIDTRYAGFEFRSRTEARWAVFFDALGVDWEYEKEGFELPSGRYLPDFWLPRLNGWIEVKGETPTSKERRLLGELIDASGCCAAVVTGPPDGGRASAVLECAKTYGGSPSRLTHLRAAIDAGKAARFEFGRGAERQQPLGPRRDMWTRERTAYPIRCGSGWVVGESDDGGGGIWADRHFDKHLACSYALLIALFLGQGLGHVQPELEGEF